VKLMYQMDRAWVPLVHAIKAVNCRLADAPTSSGSVRCTALEAMYGRPFVDARSVKLCEVREGKELESGDKRH
jgi:hypothetical protein